MNDFTIIASLISLGFFGGFSHCSSMCGPFILTQVSNRLENIELDQYSTLQKLKNLALLPYHLGRITTYSFLGFLCSLLTQNIKSFTEFRFLSAILLFLASFIFLNLLFEKKLAKLTANFFKNRLPFKSNTLKISPIFHKVFSLSFLNKFKSLLANLFKDPTGLNGYILGLILGFIPCGLLYGAFLLTASISSPILAGFGMFLFGISTFPALFITASGGFIFFKFLKTDFKIISKIIIFINSVTLFIMALSLIN